MTPIQAQNLYDWRAVISLIQRAFAGMDGRIDPPSSMYELTPKTVSDQAKTGEIWVIEDPGPVACVFLEVRPGRIYLSKLAVDPTRRGQGLGHRLLDVAEARARVHGVERITLGTRIELVENHKFFAAHGYRVIDRVSHPGFTRVTSLTMEKRVQENRADG